MDPKAMDTFGAALLAYFEGDSSAELIIRRDDGHEGRLPVGFFFRPPSEFTPVENTALELCAGHVLDAGAGTGLHSLALQEKGLRVTAIDLSPAAVQVMVRRGVADARGADLFTAELGPFDTVLMLGHGIGMVETLAGLDRFLVRARGLLAEQGQVLFDSLDVRVTDDPKNLAYHEANRRAGRYIGEIGLQSEYAGRAGPTYRWLHVDAATVKKQAADAGWACEVIVEMDSGDYLAQLT
jgi:SAM-dependent methyltransferase